MYLGEKEIKECPHKTVSRSYNSPSSASAQWRCDWCGQEFSLAIGTSKTVEINEGSLKIGDMPVRLDPGMPVGEIRFANGNVEGPKPAKKKDKSYAT